jgi:tetratricopeptide (TPR) repeat protein
MNIYKYLKYFLIFLFINSHAVAGNNFFSQGKILFEDEKIDKAKFKFEQDIVFNPKNEKSYLYLAKIYKKKNNTELEEKHLKTVLLLNPKNEEAIYELAMLNISKSDFSGASSLLEKFEKLCKNLCFKKQIIQNKLKDSLKR